MKFDFYVTKETGETLYCYNKLHKDQSETRYLISAMLSALNLYAKEGLGSEMNSVNLSNLLMTLVSNKELGINYYLITSNKEKKAKTKLEEFKKELKLKQDHVIQAAINTGYPLTNHLEYYRMLYDERIRFQ